LISGCLSITAYSFPHYGKSPVNGGTSGGC